MTQLSISTVTTQPPRRPSPRRPPADRRRDRERARLVDEAARVLRWPRSVALAVVDGNCLAESIEALRLDDARVRELARRARLLEEALS